MGRPDWAPETVDIERPSVARIYDYHLGGAHNFAVDRQVGDQLARMMPELPLGMRANRAFLQRAVRYLVDHQVRQFLDLGSGIPTVGNVHEIAQRADPRSRVVYVDIDAVAIAHAEALLRDNQRVGVVRADLRDVPGVLASPEVRRLIDFAEPVAVLLVSVLHFVPDADDPAGVVARYLDPASSGSYLVLSHAAAAEDESAPSGGGAVAVTVSRTIAEMTLRTRQQVAAMLSGTDLVPPGVVYVSQWPATAGTDLTAPPQRYGGLVGVGRKP